jgi:hypothetical protein
VKNRHLDDFSAIMFLIFLLSFGIMLLGTSVQMFTPFRAFGLFVYYGGIVLFGLGLLLPILQFFYSRLRDSAVCLRLSPEK